MPANFLPPIMTLYVDNTSRENKNNTLFAYLAWLVETRVFRQIKLGFLPVGYGDAFVIHLNDYIYYIFHLTNLVCLNGRHTHFGPDQVFSCHSRYLRHKSVYSINQLKQLLSESYKELHDDGRKTYPFRVLEMEVCHFRERGHIKGRSNRSVRQIGQTGCTDIYHDSQDAPDFNSWFQGRVNHIQNFGRHQFRFELKNVAGYDRDQACFISSKDWAVSPDWESTEKPVFQVIYNANEFTRMVGSVIVCLVVVYRKFRCYLLGLL